MMSYGLIGMIVGLMIANSKIKRLNELWEHPIAFFVTGEYNVYEVNFARSIAKL